MNSFTYKHRAVLIEETAVIGDLHIGYADIIDGFTHKDEREELIPRIRTILSEHNVETLVLNGDIFHSFESPSYDARRTFTMIQDIAETHGVDLQLIQGNHDTAAAKTYTDLPEFAGRYTITRSIISNRSPTEQKIYVSHGHTKVTEECDVLVLSHLHPVVRIEGITWPTYLYGPSNRDNIDNVLILPAINSIHDGVTVSSHTETNIPFPNIEPSEFGNLKPFIYYSEREDVTRFPKLSKSETFFRI